MSQSVRTSELVKNLESGTGVNVPETCRCLQTKLFFLMKKLYELLTLVKNSKMKSDSIHFFAGFKVKQFHVILFPF